jgi:hypothetical protein
MGDSLYYFQDRPDRSGSNMLLSLRKDAGVPSGIMLGQQAAQSASDSYQRVPVSSAPYVTLEDGTRAASSDQDSLGHALSTITHIRSLGLSVKTRGCLSVVGSLVLGPGLLLSALFRSRVWPSSF